MQLTLVPDATPHEIRHRRHPQTAHSGQGAHLDARPLDGTATLSARDLGLDTGMDLEQGRGLTLRSGATPSGQYGYTVQRMTRRLQVAALGAGPESFAHWASLYLYDVSPRCSPNTVEAKARDLELFDAWFAQEARETRVRSWRASDTQAFLSTLRGRRRAPTTINRVLATLKHFARWAQDAHGIFAAAELPTRGIAALSEEEPPCRKLSDEEAQALIAAGRKRVAEADALRSEGTADKRALVRLRPRRDLALMATMLFTGLRVQEVVVLRLDQLRDGCLWQVARKGNHETRRVYLHPAALEAIADYVRHEREAGLTGETSPIFLSSRTQSFMSRQQITRGLQALADVANQTWVGRPIHVSPHVLRHTFGAKYREASGSDTETAAALAHQSLNHVARYTRKTDDERDAMCRQTFAHI